MVTIKDVARRAEVSFTTVSHVINKSRPVSEETAERVFAAIAELGYVPSGVARALQSNRTRTIGMIVTTTTNPFFGEVIRGVERVCFKHGYALMICNTDDVASQLVVYLQALLIKRVDAIVVMTSNASPEFFDHVGQVKRVPLVAIDAPPGSVGSVFSDDSIAGGRIVAEFLADRGFTNIAVVTGPEQHPRMRDRLTGFQAALAERAIALPPGWMVRTDISMDGGLEATRAILSSGRPRPQAIFALSDIMAIGVLHGLHEAGLRVPEDVSVVGYDDIAFAAHTLPPLTTICQPSVDMGGRAAEAIISHLEANTPLPKAVQLPPELMVRDSVGFIAHPA
ncbi:LacI family DNA-binding transcriptional regulator [Devosia sp. 2618]|uniref:LacI family DNA-binding transcriptional regulator n=1 Tax=Devosia sp. 2618 TaxID=3156454 RepID=UPI003394EC85